MDYRELIELNEGTTLDFKREVVKENLTEVGDQ